MIWENPYEPPQTEPAAETLSDRSFGWEVVDGRVWVKSSVMFPKIDLYSGSTSGRMVKRDLILRCNPRWLSIIPVAGAMVGALFFGNMRPGIDMVITGAIGYVVGIALAGAFGMRSPVVTVHFHQDKSWNNLRSWIPTAGSLLLVCLPLGFTGIPDRFLHGMPLILTVWVAYIIVRRFVLRELSCPARKGERFEIRGLHKTVIEALERLQNGRPEDRPPVDDFQKTQSR